MCAMRFLWRAVNILNTVNVLAAIRGNSGRGSRPSKCLRPPINLPDAEILDIFARLNSYAVVLNEQEKNQCCAFVRLRFC
jgi:hypothetical protein